MLVEGRQVQARFTIIEGWNFSQVKQALAQLPGLVPTIDGMSDAQIMQILGRPGIHPEGRFFPDTYYLPNGSKDTVALKLAMQTMDKHLQQAWQTRNSQSVLRTPDELLTLASIIEKETGLASDRQNIASVFHNRLRIGMRLQTDPAVIYGIGQNFDGNLTKKHLRTDTAYNTYTRTGLPPTPIAMPGAAALNAAAQPAQSKYLYFVSRGDGSSAFSENLQQHNRAGIDGAGKSSHIEALAEYLRAAGLTTCLTREPGGTPLAEQLRALLLHEPMDALSEALLMFAARREHVLQVIKPALAKGQVVLCDRFTDATFAYQGYGRGFNLEVLQQLELWVQGNDLQKPSEILEPDCTFWFDLSPQVAAKRLESARKPDKFEAQSLAFFQRVAQGYAMRMQQNPQRFVHIDAAQSVEKVRMQILAQADKFIPQLASRAVRGNKYV
ncbi:unnamed protein product, partial [Darwinula stevensoni]